MIYDKKPCGEFKKCNNENCKDCPEYKEWFDKAIKIIREGLPHLSEYYDGEDDEGNIWDYKELAEDILGILEES